MENPVTCSNQCRLWSDATLCGVWSGSALFAYGHFTGLQVRMGLGEREQFQENNSCIFMFASFLNESQLL